MCDAGVMVATQGVPTDAWPSYTLYVSRVGSLVIFSFFIALEFSPHTDTADSIYLEHLSI